MRKGVFEFFDADYFVSDRLFLYLYLIGFELHGYRTDVFTTSQSFTCSFFPRLGEGVAHDVVVFFGWSADLDQRFFLGKSEKLFNNSSGQFDLLGELWNRLQRGYVHCPQETVKQEVVVQAGLFNGLG